MTRHTGSNGLCGSYSKAAVISEKFLQTLTEPFTTLNTLIGTFVSTRTRDGTLRVEHPVRRTQWITNKGKYLDKFCLC